jgi:outer membrane protein assembly factor BamA
MKKAHFWISISLLTMAFLFSCTIVKKYDPGVPFMYANIVKLRGVANKEKQNDIRERLEGQIEDSVMVNKVSKIPWPKFPWFIPVPVMARPLPYDSVAVLQSLRNMQYLMSSMGYKSSTISADSSLKKVKNQQRVTVTYQVEAGRLFTIDSVAYNISDDLLQFLAVTSRSESLLRKGEPFENGIVDQELNRLVSIFQNNGFHKFTREDIVVEADSSYSELIDPTLDPFEYIQKLAQLNANFDKPKVDIYIRLNNIRDSTHLKPFTIGSFTTYSDPEADMAPSFSDTTSGVVVDGIRIISRQQRFDPAFLARQINFKPGDVYTRDKYSQTLNNFNRLGAWQNINIVSENIDSTGKINYLLRLLPAKKQFFSVDLEGSSIINNTQVVQVGSGRVGLAVNFTLRNRNIAKRAIQLENNLRTGIEFNNFEKILSGEVTLTNRLTIPWMETPFGESFERRFTNARTIISADVSYIDRFKYFQLRAFNTFLGYEWKSNQNTTWQFKPFNFEFTLFKPDSLFKEAITDFPLLMYTYNNGLIIGANISYNHNFNPYSKKKTNLLRLYAEESGVLVGSILRGQTAKGKSLGTLYRFIKFDADFRHIINYKKSSLHFRVFGGYGHAIGTLSRKGEVTMPFFKSYAAGGPNSMRGWQIRKLGIGSNISFDTTLDGRFSDKYADIHLEGNVEYRFNLFPFYGFWMRGAVFTDIGNIWFRNDLSGQLPRADLTMNRFYKDLAVASGFGLRVDFSYFLLRFDLGFPLKDPRYGPYNTGSPAAEQFYSPNKYSWFVKDVWHKPVFQFAIGYPF